MSLLGFELEYFPPLQLCLAWYPVWKPPPLSWGDASKKKNGCLWETLGMGRLDRITLTCSMYSLDFFAKSAAKRFGGEPLKSSSFTRVNGYVNGDNCRILLYLPTLCMGIVPA